MNELRKNYKTFEDAFNDYLASWMEAEKDFGNHLPPNEQEKERLREQFKPLWEAENCKMEEMNFHYRKQ